MGITWVVGGILLVLFSSQLAAMLENDAVNDPVSRFIYNLPFHRWVINPRAGPVFGVFLIVLGLGLVVLGLTGRHP
jgi:hypothetical protein